MKRSLSKWTCVHKKNARLMLAALILVAIISLSGCAWVRAAGSLLTPSQNSGTSVRGNSLHAGPQTNRLGDTAYKDIGEVNYHYVRQTGDYVLKIVGLFGIFALLAFIIFKVFRFGRKLVELTQDKSSEL